MQRIEQVRGSYPQFRQSGYGREWARQNKISLILAPVLFLMPVGLASDPNAAAMTAGQAAMMVAGMALVGLSMWAVWSYQVFQVWEGKREKTYIA